MGRTFVSIQRHSLSTFAPPSLPKLMRCLASGSVLAARVAGMTELEVHQSRTAKALTTQIPGVWHWEQNGEEDIKREFAPQACFKLLSLCF
jgi:hypothetical protein